MFVVKLDMRMPAPFLPFGSQTGSQTTEVQALTGECALPRVKRQWNCPVMATRSGNPGAGMPGLAGPRCGGSSVRGLPDVLAGRLTRIAARVSAAACAPERAFRGPVPACAYRQPAYRRLTAAMP